MPECKNIQEEFSALLDDELDGETRDAIEEHLSDCSDCLRELHSLKISSDRYRSLPRVPAPEGFEEAVMQAVRPRGQEARCLRMGAPRLLGLAAATLLVVCGGVLWAVWRSGEEAVEMQLASHAAEDAPAAGAQQERAPEMAEDAVAMSAPMAADADQANIAAEETAPAEAAPKDDAALADRSAPANPQETARAVRAPAPQAEPEAEGMVQEQTPSREIAGRTFLWREDVWEQQEYAGEAVETIGVEGTAFAALVAEEPALAELIALDAPVIFEADGEWRRLEIPAESPTGAPDF